MRTGTGLEQARIVDGHIGLVGGLHERLPVAALTQLHWNIGDQICGNSG